MAIDNWKILIWKVLGLSGINYLTLLDPSCDLVLAQPGSQRSNDQVGLTFHPSISGTLLF